LPGDGVLQNDKTSKQETFMATTMENLSTKWLSAKPMLYGLAIGLIAGPLISNYMGWQVTSSAAREQAHAGVVELKATACNAQARIDNPNSAKLDWSGRNDLAKKWAVMPGGTAADSDVVSACSNKLAA
jgi:hypothetical protein